MKILHYFLGFPPYRSGGLTKYCCDLMKVQSNNKNEVIALWPGKMNFIFDKEVKIKKRKNWEKIFNYEIINPLPVSLLDGVKNIEEYTKSCNKAVYRKFLKKIQPDVIHIHTFMGLHKEFLEVAKEMNIRTFYTTHDYFGICPKVTLLKENLPCKDDNNCEDCVKCNINALSMKKIKLLQSPIYRIIKNLFFIKILRKKHKEESEKKENNIIDTKLKGDDYKELRNYYINMFELIDFIHFNSSLTKDIYYRYMKGKIKGEVFPITHGHIKDNRKIKKFEGKLKITYLGPTKSYKGFYLLLDSLDGLYKDTNFELNIYYNTNENREYIKQHSSYKYDQLEEIFDNTDVLVAPSIWYETFGFTVLEALSYGVPVIVTENVGAKDIVEDFGFVVKPNKEALKKIISNILINKDMLTKKNKKIYERLKIPDILVEYDRK